MIKHDSNIAARFATFRKTYIAKGQIEAAKLLGVSQSKISDIEASKLAPDFYLIQKMTIDYGLNFEWLATGRGELVFQKDTNKKVNLMSDLSAILVETETLKKMLTMNQMTVNHLLKIIEKLDARVVDLEGAAKNKNRKSAV